MNPNELADSFESDELRAYHPNSKLIVDALRLKAALDWLFERGDGRYVERWSDGTFEAGDGDKLACPTGHGNNVVEAILALKSRPGAQVPTLLIEGVNFLVTADLPWATSVDSCLRDLLPAVREKYPKAEWEFVVWKDGASATFFSCDTKREVHSRKDRDLATAICLVFLEVMKND